jgi:peptidoglycan/LPS O-acetylase OafA/YrhL
MSKKRISELDGLRVIAALGVVWIHSWTFCGNPAGWHSIYRAFAILGNGVDFFFVISGFFMYMIFYKKKFSAATYGQFILKRWKRIAPAFYVSAACYVLWFGLQDSNYPSVLNLFINILFLNNIYQAHEIIAPFWSLATEWQFYMLLPLLFCFRGRNMFLGVLVGCSLLSVIFFYLITRHFNDASYWFWERQIIARFSEFGWGILAAYLFVKQVKVSSWLRGVKGNLVGLMFCVAGRVMMMTEFYSHTGGFSTFSRSFSVTLMTFGFAVICYSVIMGRSVFSRFLATWPMQYIGRISYSIYLWHSLVIFLMEGILVKFHRLPFYSLWVFVVVTFFTIVISALSYRLLEASYFKSRLSAEREETVKVTTEVYHH